MKYSNQQFQNLLNKFNKLNILVVGDLMLDKYITGSVHRISPEAPVPVVKVSHKEFRVGGAGNVATNLASLHCNVSLAGICGNDESGRHIAEKLNENNIDQVLIFDDTRPTTVKTRIIAQHQQVVRIDEEENNPHYPGLLDILLNKMLKTASKFDGIILSDYNKGLLSADLIKNIIASFPDIPIIIDPKGHDYTRYSQASALKPHWNEFKTAINQPDLTIGEIEQEALKLIAELDLKGLVVTLGENGVFVLDENHKSTLLPTVARDVFDVSGAGDTFIAAFTAGLLVSNNWLMAATLANIASGIVVSKVGTAVVHNHEILDNLHLYQ